MSCCSRLTAFRQKLNCGIGIPKRTFSNTGTFGSLHRKPCPATPPRATKDDRTKTHTSLRGSVIPHCSPRDCVVDMADGLVTRELEAGDFHKGFLKLLSALTTVGDISEDAFKARFDELKSRAPDYRISVIEDTETGKIIATAALLVERKFIHECGKVGHIEDVVVDQTYRGKQLGKRVIEDLVEFSKGTGCYKVILDCSEDNVKFYEKCGLERKEVQMVKYLDR